MPKEARHEPDGNFQKPGVWQYPGHRRKRQIPVLRNGCGRCAGVQQFPRSGLVLGLLSTVIALLGVAVLITYSPQNGVILLVMAFLISPMGLPLAAIWLLGKVQSLKFAIQDWVYG